MQLIKCSETKVVGCASGRKQTFPMLVQLWSTVVILLMEHGRIKVGSGVKE